MIENKELLEYVGETWSDKLKREISKYYFEKKQKQYETIENNVYPMSIVRVTNPNETEIKSIGCSCVNDLLNDNFGNFLAGVLSGRFPATTPMTDDLGASKPISTYGTGSTYNSTSLGNVGTEMQIGKGLTPVTRQDFKVESAFPSSPEAGVFNNGLGGYNSGLGEITVDGVLSPTGGTGAISETCLFAVWVHTGSTRNTYMLSHDNISPVVNFIIGESVTVEYILSLS